MQTTEPGAIEAPRVPDTTTLPPPGLDATCLECWAAGWAARETEVAQLARRLERAESDADRYYRAAFDTPADVQDRITEAAEEHWQRFLNGEPL